MRFQKRIKISGPLGSGQMSEKTEIIFKNPVVVLLGFDLGSVIGKAMMDREGDELIANADVDLGHLPADFHMGFSGRVLEQSDNYITKFELLSLNFSPFDKNVKEKNENE